MCDFILLILSFFSLYLSVCLSLSLSLSVCLSLSLSFSLFRHPPRHLFSLFIPPSLEVYERSCIKHMSLFMEIFDRVIEVKSLQSFHISFFSLSDCLSLSFSPSVSLYFLSSYCVSMDLFVLVIV